MQTNFMMKLGENNFEYIFRIHATNICNYRAGMACFNTVKHKTDLVKKLNEIVFNMSIELNENILASDQVLFTYLDIVSNVYPDSMLDELAANLENEIDLLLGQKRIA